MNNRIKQGGAGQIALMAVSFVMIGLLLFPAFYALSISLQDEFSIYKSKPQFIPQAGRSVTLVLDYSGMQDEPNLESMLKQDTTVAMFGIYKEQIKEGITAIEVIGTMNGKQIFRSRAHTAKLALEKDYGVYAKTNPTQAVLLKEKNYTRFMASVRYEFDAAGLKNQREIRASAPELGKLQGNIANVFGDKYTLHGQIGEVSVRTSVLQLFEKYLYYFALPNYMFSGDARIAQYGLWAFSFNTIVTTVWAMLCQMFIPAFTAYPLAVLFKRRTANGVLLVFLITMMIPFASIMVPQLILMKQLGMYDNYWAMLFPWLLPSPFYILLYKSFFQRIPPSLFEAARIDGASEMYTFTRICMPLSKSIISLIAIQAFISGWCDFFWYYLATKNVRYWTLNVAIFNIANSKVIKQNFLMGISIATLIPIIIVAFVFSKQLKSEVISAAVKG